jgi:hypothetical protein
MATIEQPKTLALSEYSREIGPLVRTIATKKELLKDFKESDEEAIALSGIVKTAQANLKAYVESSDRGKELLTELKEVETDLKLALKAAARATKDTPKPYKTGELRPYFVARNKAQKAVTKVIKKGDTFVALETELSK